MHILLTNDDGIAAPGLAALYGQLAKLGEVSVAAPDSPQSASAHAITVDAPLSVSRVHVQNLFYGYAVAGRPADCVKLAISELVQPKPDLVVSGINDGANVSINVLYSGTVAAAAEGALLGIPSIAVSLERADELDFDGAARIARTIVEHIIDRGLRAGELLNVNIPSLRPGRPMGVRVTPQSVLTMDDRYVSQEGPDGFVRYWLQGSFKSLGPESDTDLRAIRDGYVAITPLHFDLTERPRLKELRGWDWPDLGM